MQYNSQAWLGRWDNFEGFIDSTDPYLTLAWQEAETAAGAMPMFRSGVKNFWQQACKTTSPENPISLGGWCITPAEGKLLRIEWLAEDGKCLGKAIYHLDSILPSGLEGKENAVLAAEDVPSNWPFRILLTMEPMPPSHCAGPGRASEPPAFSVRQQPGASGEPRHREASQPHVVRHHVRR